MHEYVIKKVSDLVPYINNSRTHSEEQTIQIASSISEFGFTNPVLIDDTNNLIAGHGRLLAAKKLGLEEVPAIVLTGLSKAQKKAYVIADNQLALNSGWDLDMLKIEIEGLKELDFDIGLLGFEDDFLDGLLEEDPAEGLTDEDEVPEPPETPVSVLGDIWQLGNHRLMCGDSTSIDAVDKLMDGNKVDLLFTDPPYNVAFNGRSGKHDVIKNDNLSENDFGSFIENVIQTIKTIDPPIYYVWCNWKFYGILQEALEYKSCIVWAKNVFGMGNGYRHQHEFCLYNGKIDGHIKNESDLWNVKKDHSYVHPTQKPVELSVRAFSNHIKQKNVLDLFGGSGSTLIGAEQCGRKAFLMELDEKYVDVIISRWQSYTGKEAIHIESGKTYKELKDDQPSQ
jgi:DNA modification methylase